MEANNVAAMREALYRIGNIAGFVSENCGDQQTATYMNDIISNVQAALAVPPRNCDVGTAEEQAERYFRLKKEHCDNMARCPHVGYAAFFHDSLEWAQMPYEATKGYV